MLISVVPLLVAIVGLIIYVVATNAKVVRLGEILLFCGTLVTLLVFARDVVRLGG